MHASVRWLNEYLTPSNVSVDAVIEALVHAGFPIESREDLGPADGGPDARLDVEITSNRGDCLSMVGLAREIAAKAGLGFAPPKEKALHISGAPIGQVLQLQNDETQACPLFTVRVIKGVKVGPSPAWLVRALAAVGQRSINNVVDVTNYICFELGNPCHVFDLAKLAGASLVVRFAKEGEPLKTLDGKSRTLKSTDLVVADAERPQSLAGVIGGADSEVSAATTDVVLEMATWDPVTIRRAARRMSIRTDAGYRFERTVDARMLEAASRRAAAMIVEVAGGSLCEGVLTAGGSMPATKTIEMRFTRCRDVLGFGVEDACAVKVLASLGVECAAMTGGVRCTIPAWRTDLKREIDLIEEIARIKGLESIPVHETLPVSVRPPQRTELAARELASVMTGLGFFEAVTFSFARPEHAEAWRPEGMRTVAVDGDRRGAEPTLRPSVVPGLLGSRKANQDGQVSVRGGVRLYEISAVFGENDRGSVEHRNLGFVLDVPVAGKKPTAEERQAGVRAARGVVEAVVTAMYGSAGEASVVGAGPHCKALNGEGYARVMLGGVGGTALGYFGLVSDEMASAYGLDGCFACGELNLAVLTAGYPPKSRVEMLPTFPAVEKDLSPVVDEGVTWDRVRETVSACGLARLEAVDFVGVYRGKQLGAGKKSLTLRMRFRDASTTLRHEDVNAEVTAVMDRLVKDTGASWRT